MSSLFHSHNSFLLSWFDGGLLELYTLTLFILSPFIQWEGSTRCFILILACRTLVWLKSFTGHFFLRAFQSYLLLPSHEISGIVIVVFSTLQGSEFLDSLHSLSPLFANTPTLFRLHLFLVWLCQMQTIAPNIHSGHSVFQSLPLELWLQLQLQFLPLKLSQAIIVPSSSCHCLTWVIIYLAYSLRFHCRASLPADHCWQCHNFSLLLW